MTRCINCRASIDHLHHRAQRCLACKKIKRNADKRECDRLRRCKALNSERVADAGMLAKFDRAEGDQEPIRRGRSGEETLALFRKAVGL